MPKRWWNRFSPGIKVSELLLPLPVTGAMLLIMRACENAIAHYRIKLTPAPVELIEIAKSIAHPWVWSRKAVGEAERIGALVGIPFGIALGIALRFFPKYGSPPLASGIALIAIMAGITFVWPFAVSQQLIRRWHGNKVPAVVAAVLTMEVALLLAALLNRGLHLLVLPILMPFIMGPFIAFWVWLTAPIIRPGDPSLMRYRL